MKLNCTADQRAMVAEGARERRSKLAVSEHSARAGEASAAARNGNTSVNVSDVSKPKRDTRAEVARESKIPERKLRAAAEVKNPSTAKTPTFPIPQFF
jgi:hypothetical protein